MGKSGRNIDSHFDVISKLVCESAFPIVIVAYLVLCAVGVLSNNFNLTLYMGWLSLTMSIGYSKGAYRLVEPKVQRIYGMISKGAEPMPASLVDLLVFAITAAAAFVVWDISLSCAWLWNEYSKAAIGNLLTLLAMAVFFYDRAFD